MTNNTLSLIPADQFSLETLVAIYNRTRTDYLIPMPMNVPRLEDYIRAYDVSLSHSLVAVLEGEALGVAMLGVRQDRAWITRLGVIPDTRRLGAGKALMTGLLEQAKNAGLNFSMLEVIKNNTPAHQLFLKMGFYETGELLVLRRPFLLSRLEPVSAEVRWLERAEALDLLGRDRGIQPWTNQTESLFNVQDISGLHLRLADGSTGWLLFQRQECLLTRFAYKTEAGDPVRLALAFLNHLHHQYPRLDTQLENMQVKDPHLAAFYKMGYVEAFRRIEMWRGEPPASLKRTAPQAVKNSEQGS
ncbi:MAG: GNAT family N-acetyltransferase [Anaerolineales bacterium]|jgi:ribosomal protein S18 acetylase RimI-like enzyme|nr:GNAT family N-acetyltransferase [Anaerolineales bacterium]